MSDPTRRRAIARSSTTSSRQISDTGLFKRRLKTELFRRAYVAIVLVSAPGRSVNSAIEMTVLLLLLSV